MFTVLTETVLGALTGYVTNDIATRQLFRPGGIVEREREGFTDMLVDMLSKEILGPEMMAELFSDPKVEAVFHNVAIALVDEVMPQALADVKLQDGLSGAMLYNAFFERVESTEWPKIAWNDKALVAHVTAFLQSDALQKTMALALAELSLRSPSDLGLWPVVRNRLLTHPLLNQEERLPWLDANEYRIRAKIDEAITRLEKNEKWRTVPLGEWLHLDAADLSERILLLLKDEDTMTAAISTWRSWWLQDAVREWAGEFLHRVLEEVVDLHLYDVMSAAVSALQQDREQLEEMVLRSVSVALDGLSIEPAVRRLVREWFAGDGESDWLSHLFIAQSRTSKQRELCAAVVNRLERTMLSKVQSLWTDTADAKRIIKWLERHADELLRPLILRAAEKLLQRTPAEWVAQVLDKEHIGEILWQLLKRLAEEEEWADLFKARVAIITAKPLRDTLLSDEMQRRILRRMQRVTGVIDADLLARELIARPMSSEILIRRFADWVFRQPLLEVVSVIMQQTPMHDALQEVLEGDIADHVLLTMPSRLADIAREQIDALSHDELRELALSIIGREMRPLAWLGGAVGSVVGAASGTAFALGGNYVDPSAQALWVQSGLFAARSGMYGAVGYGTNVLAVKGLFRPYEKHFIFQGLLPKNQSRFADKMRELTHEYVVNEDIWQEVQGALGIYAMRQGHRRLEAFAGHWQRHAMQYKGAVLKQVGAIRLQPVLDTLDMRELIEETIAYLMKSDVVQRSAKKVLLSVAESLIQEDAGQNKYIRLFLARSPSLLASLSEQDAVRQGEAHLLDKITGADEAEIYRLLMGGANRIQLPQQGAPAYRQVWQLLENIYDELPLYLQQSARRLSKKFAKSMRKTMSFSMELMFRIAGGDIYIRKAIEHFATQELPAYLDDRRRHFKYAFLAYCDDTVAERSLADIGIVPSIADARFLKSLLTDEERCNETAERLHRHLWRDWLPAVVEGTDWALIKQRAGYRLLHSDVQDKAQHHTSRIEAFLDARLAALSPEWIGKMADWAGDRLTSPLIQSFTELELRDIISEASLSEIYDAAVSPQDEALEKALAEAMARRVCVILDDAWPILAPLFDRYGRELLQEIQLPDVTYRQVCALDSAHLEDMVRQIANPYFRHVERMGWLGAVVAIPATWLAFFIQ